MTRNLFIAAAFALGMIILLFVGGLAGANPLLLMTALLCAFPAFAFTLGAGLGRASNEFQVIRKNTPTNQVRKINSRTVQGDTLSS